MKKQNNTLSVALAAFVLLSCCCACNNVPEQPPLNEGYDSSFVLPEAEYLSAEDRAIIEAMENEYDENVNK